jgi:hypothetical protein
VRDSVGEDRGGGRTVAITLAAFTMLGIIGVAALAAPLLRHDPTAAAGAPPSPSGQPYLCLEQPSPDHPGDHPCSRIAADNRRRRALTTTEQASAQPVIDTVTAALVRHSRTQCATPPGPCTDRILPADPTEVRRQLAAIGYSDAMVRLYRDGDPAPAGSVVYAVKVRDRCLLGYLPTDRPGQLRAVGPLPDGTCLPA